MMISLISHHNYNYTDINDVFYGTYHITVS